MKIFVHIAVDHYGAECLAKLKDVLSDLAAADRERHLYVWGGCGKAPKIESYWSVRYPAWDDIIELPYKDETHGPPELTLDRSLLAKSIKDAFWGGPIGEKFVELCSSWPYKTLGPNQPYQSVVTLSGSLGDPAGSSVLLGFLSGLAGLRVRGIFNCNVFCVVGIGAASGTLDRDKGKDDRIRVLAARGLLDLQAFLTKSSKYPEWAFPVYLVGERQIADVDSDRRSQMAMGGLALLSITRSIIEDQYIF